MITIGIFLRKRKIIQTNLVEVMTFAKPAVAFMSTMILVIPILVASPSLGSTMYMNSKASILQSSYVKIRAAVGAEMQHDIAYIKTIENKTSSPSLSPINPVQGRLVVTETPQKE